jgi:hypothetical protein
MSTIEELLERKNSDSGLERIPGGTLYLQKLALNSLTSGGYSGGGDFGM